MKQQTYKFPKGDFLSGFSKSDEPCSYELECQRMVIRGVEYLDQHPDLFERIKLGGVGVGDKIIRPMIDFMCIHEDNDDKSGGQTGAMVTHTVKVAFAAKKIGWDKYIEKITQNK